MTQLILERSMKTPYANTTRKHGFLYFLRAKRPHLFSMPWVWLRLRWNEVCTLLNMLGYLLSDRSRDGPITATGGDRSANDKAIKNGLTKICSTLGKWATETSWSPSKRRSFFFFSSQPYFALYHSLDGSHRAQWLVHRVLWKYFKEYSDSRASKCCSSRTPGRGARQNSREKRSMWLTLGLEAGLMAAFEASTPHHSLFLTGAPTQAQTDTHTHVHTVYRLRSFRLNYNGCTWKAWIPRPPATIPPRRALACIH